MDLLLLPCSLRGALHSRSVRRISVPHSFLLHKLGDRRWRAQRETLDSSLCSDQLSSLGGSSPSEAPPHTTATTARFYPWDQRDGSSFNANIEKMMGCSCSSRLETAFLMFSLLSYSASVSTDASQQHRGGGRLK